MSDSTARNRLDEEASPYLRQHADNPVHWQPWDEAALAAARERDVPIFLSVGYSSCHWCHVMAEESFEDDGVAELLNERFVPVKVDREERPDVDRVYQTICQLVTRRGGWPLSAWLTPDGRPFYVGTYFPTEPARGMPGFRELLERIADSWADPDQRAEMEERADQWTAAIKGELEEVPQPADDREDGELLEGATNAALRAADRQFGGFGSGGPKFPQPARVEALLRADATAGRSEARAVAVETLDAMADGGMFDHVGGGFHRYATDREWTVPHFEKMLYDNAALAALYCRGFQATGDERYADVARRTLAFVERELTHPDGGFYSTLDARSATPDPRLADGEEPEQEEGAFYTWTPAEVREAIAGEGDEGVALPGGGSVDDDLLADLAVARWGVTAGGNFEGTTVLTAARDVEDLAGDDELAGDGELADDDELAGGADLTPADVEALLAAARERLLAARERRPRPARDEKVLASWNGLAISAFAAGALVLDPRYADVAADALAFVREHLWDAGERRLSRRVKDGEVAVDGYLEDYAFLARGALDAYGATGDVDHLAFALDLARAVRERFWEAEEGTLYFTPAGGESLVARPQEPADQSTPSSLGVALEVLAALDHVAPEDGFDDVVERTLATWRGRVAANPLEHATLALVADDWHRGATELTLAAAGGVGDWPAGWREALAGTYLPGALLAPRPPDEDGLAGWLDALDLEAAPPIWADRGARDGEPTVYACRSFVCSPPSHDLAEALDWLAENAAPAGE